MMYVRPGELRVLTWADVDLEAGHVRITKARDYEEGEVKPPKTRNGVRNVPIELSLRPLLEDMRVGKDREAIVGASALAAIAGAGAGPMAASSTGVASGAASGASGIESLALQRPRLRNR